MPYNPIYSTGLLNVNNSINRFTLDVLKDSIFVREVIESSLNCRLTWSRVSPTHWTTIHYEFFDSNLDRYDYNVYRLTGNRFDDIYELSVKKNGVCIFEKQSDEVTEIIDLARVIDTFFRSLVNIGEVAGCNEGRRSVELNDIEGEYLYIPHDKQKGLNPDKAFTIMTWARITEKSKVRNIIQKGEQYRLYYDNTLDKIRFQVTTTAGVETLTSIHTPPLNGWFFVVATYDDVAGETTLQINRETAAVKTDVSVIVKDEESDFQIGKEWEGRIDKTTLYKGFIPDEFRDVIWNSGRGVGYPKMPRCTQILGHWEMNEEIGIRYDTGPQYNHLLESSEGTEWAPGINSLNDDV